MLIKSTAFKGNTQGFGATREGQYIQLHCLACYAKLCIEMQFFPRDKGFEPRSAGLEALYQFYNCLTDFIECKYANF